MARDPYAGGRNTEMNILQGIKVIDVTSWAFVPSVGGVMAHWGADVIKVESPKAPDPMRLLGGSLEPGGASNSFKHYSRGKRSIAIDLAKPQGQQLIHRLAADADVFLTSYLAPTRRKLKIDVEDIRKVNPNIIYARGSGYGPKGPEADRPGYDSISWWNRSSLAQSAMDSSGRTWPMGMVGHGDGMSGLVFAGGVCAALLHRERTGEAVVVDSSLMGTGVWFNGLELIASQFAPRQRQFGPVERPRPGPGALPGLAAATMYLYQTQDYRFINLLFLGDDDRDFADLCRLLDRPELAADPRFVHAPQRQANTPALTTILEDIFATKPLEAWKQILVKARGAWAALQTPEEVHTDPQTLANGFLRHVDYPDGGLKVPVPPILFDEEAGDPPRAPDFAEHTDQILHELGCTPDDIVGYREAGVIA
jgi:crotonobetainyl-CoA:carnitine CoA-transferase CaiB-like acyl-CoA transferase